MEDLKEAVVTESERATSSLTLREVAGVFNFLSFLSVNPTIVDDFRQEHKVYTYIRVHHHAFVCNPTNDKIRWWLESHYSAYTYDNSFSSVGSNSKMENFCPGARNLTEDN